MWYDLDHTEGCENLLSLQEPAAESSAARCSDGAPSAPLKSSDTRATSSCKGSETESLTTSRSGTMFAPSTERRGGERSTSSAEVSHAKTSAVLGEDSELSAESEADYGESTLGSFARYDRDTASWKTAQCLLLGGLESFSGTWPRSGMMRRGRCYPLAIAAHRINGRGCGLSEKFPTPTVFGNNNRKGISPKAGDGLATYVKKFPTPCSHDSFDMYLKDSSTSKFDSARRGLSAFVRKWPTPQSRDFKTGMASRVERSWRNLNDWVTKFPTPCRTDYKGAGKTGTFRDRLDYAAERGRTKSNVYPTPRTNGMCGGSGAWAQMGRLVREGKMTDKERHQIGAGNGGKLNPDWVEWLMGWPIGWTASKPLEMDRFQSWRQGRFVN